MMTSAVCRASAVWIRSCRVLVSSLNATGWVTLVAVGTLSAAMSGDPQIAMASVATPSRLKYFIVILVFPSRSEPVGHARLHVKWHGRRNQVIAHRAGLRRP